MFTSIKPHECGESNHEFESRYNVSAPTLTPEMVSAFGDETGEFLDLDDFVRMLEETRERQYIYDLCIHCGKVVKPE